MSTQEQLKSLISQFKDSWLRSDKHSLAKLFSSDIIFKSHHHGSVNRQKHVSTTLSEDFKNYATNAEFTNTFTAHQKDFAAASSYAYVDVNHGQKRFLCGCTFIFHFVYENQQWLINHIKFQVNWNKGQQSLLPNWNMLPGVQGWQLVDGAPTIVSELHSPWALIRKFKAAEPKQALIDLYNKYAFAVDNCDINLLIDCYSQDIQGSFPPLGDLSGRESVIGSLKNFRLLAPFWQHFAQLVKMEVSQDKKAARFIIARIIPEKPVNDGNQKIYAAHYQLAARLESDNCWRLYESHYIPGWFDEQNLPEFII